MSPYNIRGRYTPDNSNNNDPNTNDTQQERKGLFSRITEHIKSWFLAQLEAFREFFTSTAPEFFKKMIGGLMSAIGEFEENNWIDMLTMFKQLGVLDDNDIENLIKFKNQFPYLDAFLYVFIAFTLFTGMLKEKNSILMGTFRQRMNELYSPNVPDMMTLLRASFIAPEKINEIRQRMRANGFSDDDIDLFFISAYRLYDVATIRTLYLRGEIDEQKMFERMRELGYTDTRIKEIVKTWDIIPSPSDILWMVSKEAFEPDSIEKMGLMDEFPTEQIEWLKKQGLNEYWIKKYWIAHWEQPSIEQGFEMLHRGVIDWDDLDMLFRTVEIPRYWREKLTKIAYHPYDRVDVRRMHELGVLSDDELVRAYKDLGYDDEKALNLAKFTIRYNQQNNRSLTMEQILSAYREKAIEKNEAIELLKNLSYSDEHARFLVTFEDYKEQLEYQKMIVNNIRDRYINNLIDKNEAITRLNKLDLPAQQINILIDKWDIDKFEDRKLPSKTDLEKFYKLKIINDDEYRQEMKKLGYNWKQIEWYLQALKKKKR